MRTFLFLLFSSIALGASPCIETILEIRHPLIIAVDYDGTLVDTDRILVTETIPAVVNKLLLKASQTEQGRWRAFLDGLSTHQTLYYPHTYDPVAWSCPRFGFPADVVGGGAQAFWGLMRTEFGARAHGNFPPIEAFCEFSRRLNGIAEWVVITARTSGTSVAIRSQLEKVGLPSDTPILDAGKVSGRNSSDNALKKVEQLFSYRDKNGRPIGVFVDNDPANLNAARERFGDSLILILVRRKDTGHELVLWPAP